MLKPVLPFVTDAIAHTFFYYKHVSTVHSVNGKNHVHNEFVHESKKENAPAKTDANKKIDNSDDLFFLPFNSNLTHCVFSKKQLSFLNIAICKKHAECNFPPPKFI
jgi:hypothetical protein